eukprot:scaffold77003_cov33-Tisochrysis_lutea.AAC.6
MSTTLPVGRVETDVAQNVRYSPRQRSASRDHGTPVVMPHDLRWAAAMLAEVMGSWSTKRCNDRDEGKSFGTAFLSPVLAVRVTASI